MSSTQGFAMDQAVLNAAEPAPPPLDRERPQPPPVLMPGWRCLPHALIRANGEEGFVDLAALNAARGVALVALLEPDEEASPDEARAALRAMLEQEGFERRFPGELPVVALAQRRSETDQLAAAVDRAFAALPRLSLADGWMDWLAERLGPQAPPIAPQLDEAPATAVPAPAPIAPRLDGAPPAAEPAPPPPIASRRDDTLPLAELAPTLTASRLDEVPPAAEPAPAPIAPRRDETLPVAEPAPALIASRLDELPPERTADAPTLLAPTRDDAAELALAAPIEAPAEAPPQSASQEAGSWLDWGASFGFAAGLVLALIVGFLALLSRAGRIF